MKAKKSLGQHFLNQPSIAEKIANSILIDPNYENVLEVGPGMGMLTQFLLQRFPQLIMVETDINMVHHLQERFPNVTGQIFHADFLAFDLDKVLPSKFTLVGNFPYNISSQILFKMLEHRQRIPHMVGMFQKEVADRIASRHGSKSYGILSVLLQTYYEVELLFNVSAQCFSPPPKVQSAVIRLVARKGLDISPDLEKSLKRVVKMAFNQRRKMMRNSLRSIWPANLDPDDPILTKRPEQLSVPDFLELTKRLVSLH